LPCADSRGLALYTLVAVIPSRSVVLHPILLHPTLARRPIHQSPTEHMPLDYLTAGPGHEFYQYQGSGPTKPVLRQLTPLLHDDPHFETVKGGLGARSDWTRE
jgi:hypothetical protein